MEGNRRRNTAEEIASLGATQRQARRRGVVALGAGAATALAAAAAVYLVSQQRTPLGDARAAARPSPPTPAAQLDAPEPSSATAKRGPGRPAARPKNPVLALAAPTGLPRPASPGPGPRREQVDLASLARSLAEQKKGAVQLCFERELKRDPRLRGSLLVALELKAPRSLGLVDVQTSVRRPTFVKCVGRAMQSVDFPALEEDVRVEIPFVLQTPEW